jgi:transcription-repair coupling factor (superfamily II helicase)
MARLERNSRLSPRRRAEGLVVDAGGKPGRNFAPERADDNANVFEAAIAHIRDLQGAGTRVIVAGWSDGSRERLSHVLADHGLKSVEPVSSLTQALALRKAGLRSPSSASSRASRPAIWR